MRVKDVVRLGAIVCFFFFKEKTAYEVSGCFGGSEVCIRDSPIDDDRDCHEMIPAHSLVISVPQACEGEFPGAPVLYKNRTPPPKRIVKIPGGPISLKKNT